MAYASMDEALLDHLVAYLQSTYDTYPPLGGVIGKMRFGKLQDSPEKAPAVVTLHIGSIDDPNWYHIPVKEAESTRDRIILPGIQEIGGGMHWWYRYTCAVKYFMTRSGETREDAMGKAASVINWLNMALMRAQPGRLELNTVTTPLGSETFVRLTTQSAQKREGGGPPRDFIWRATIPFEALVYVDA